MDTFGKALDLLFRRTPVEIIRSHLEKSCVSPTECEWSYEGYDVFLRYAETVFSGYSTEEQQLLYKLLQEERQERAVSSGHSIPLALAVVFRLGKKLLAAECNEPVCHYETMEEWREIYYLVGQDMLVTAFLAENDLRKDFERYDFGWVPVLRTDHREINGIIANGIAENHRHLNGSTQLFEISWVALMNDPYLRMEVLRKMNHSLQGIFIRENTDVSMSIEEKIVLAALLRTILFRRLTASKADSNQSRDRFIEEYLKKLEHEKTLRTIVDSLRFQYGATVKMHNGNLAVLDYALGDVLLRDSDANYRCLAGERSFMYQCFQAAIRGVFTGDELTMFYLYLALKTVFRGEMIQVNKQVGFRNFKDYQDRKDFFWDGTPYEWEAYRMAINGPIATQHILSMESRIAPKTTAEGILKKVAQLDKATAYAQYSDNAPKDGREDLRYKAFYVVHFIKEDDDPQKEHELDLRCRHEKVRHRIMLESLALAEALSIDDHLCERIYGIDACNLELNCRPEVFAQAYRFLTDFHPGMLHLHTRLATLPKPRLGRTYHVGEDFYSIPDGLRAIDEAIHFLGLRRGDRLGHALALGIEPDIHSACKAEYIVMPRQNYLDTLVWMLFRGHELNASLPSKLSDKYRRKAKELLHELYGDVSLQGGWEPTLEEYYDSMQLRADDPACYKNMMYQPILFPLSPWQRYAISPAHDLEALRNNPRITGLYYYYHYGRKEKRAGERPIQIPSSKEENTFIREMQDSMMELVCEKGLCIETNPTSNVLIGTFREYKYHPIFRFNRTGLDAEERKTQLNVCINTDDLGIFDTALDFEYAMIYKTLDMERNEDGTKRYSENQAIGYIKRLRELGLEASFRRSI